ncbi:putative Inhibin beta A chain [Hypsibius exemplaris]|uniref:Inhibin beta A chain n=1 Tax=Hypsibius exemplaris TaxID=2072580 RepID=A0A9X6NA45_HYPEX|nr:putative Inhibin beta A chain [Hypsibius exemplaris]
MDATRCLLQLFCLVNAAFSLLLPSVETCSNCNSNKNGNSNAAATASEVKAMQALRIEMVKQKILEKLRMTSVPVIQKSKRPVPPRILRDMMMYGDQHDGDLKEYGLDEFYAKESQMVIFAEIGGGRCVSKSPQHIACLSFNMPALVFKKHVSEATLHLNIKRGHPQRALNIRDKFDEKEPIQPVDLNDVKDGWHPVDLTLNVRKWVRRDSQVSFSIQVSCETCQPSELQKMIGLDGDHAPFMVINIETKSNHRNRRGSDCSPGMAGCCREILFLNFTDIGWDNWIIEPKGYNANYCKGTCQGFLSNTMFHHSSILSESLIKSNKAITEAGIAPCCAPTRMNALNLLFYDGDGSVHRSLLPNMSVDSCGCS